VPHLAITEAAWVLESLYELDVAAIATAVDMLLNHEQLTVQDADVVAAALTHFRRQPRVGFSDCLMVEVARKAGHSPLGTFDRALARIEGAHRLR
jgi:predicted nucleic-acid-binding protein